MAESSYQTFLYREIPSTLSGVTIRGVYEKVHAMATKSSGLSLLPKLTYTGITTFACLYKKNFFRSGAEHVCCQCSGIL